MRMKAFRGNINKVLVCILSGIKRTIFVFLRCTSCCFDHLPEEHSGACLLEGCPWTNLTENYTYNNYENWLPVLKNDMKILFRLLLLLAFIDRHHLVPAEGIKQKIQCACAQSHSDLRLFILYLSNKRKMLLGEGGLNKQIHHSKYLIGILGWPM